MPILWVLRMKVLPWHRRWRLLPDVWGVLVGWLPMIGQGANRMVRAMVWLMTLLSFTPPS